MESLQVEIVHEAAQVSKERQSSSRRCSILSVAVLTNLLAGGFVFGFSSLLVVLRQERVYAWLCATNQTMNSTNSTEAAEAATKMVITCVAQELGLARIFLAGNICAIGSTLPVGIIMDSFGPKTTAVVSFSFMILGAFLFAISSKALDLYVLAFGFMGVAAPGCIMSTFHTTALFPVHRGTVMAVVNAAYEF